ncbi:integrase catalytic domain-containing protein [Trichonephila clavipes]|nr:integrase catalytic domain-containing protein [Trichonephila clavipes]
MGKDNIRWDREVEDNLKLEFFSNVGFSEKNELWSVFVNNRVQEIRGLTDPTSWKHLPGALNPDDLPSRGCSAHQLLCSRWWEGPKWVLQTEENWPVAKPIFDEPSVLKEKGKKTTSKNVPVVCSLNQCENSGKNNNKDSG